MAMGGDPEPYLNAHASSRRSTIHDDANSLLLAIRECFRFDLPVDQRIGRLQRNHRRNFLRALDLRMVRRQN